jgi:hypothetical protein
MKKHTPLAAIAACLFMVCLAPELRAASGASSSAAALFAPAPPDAIAAIPTVQDLGAMDLHDLDRFSITSLDQLSRVVTPAQPHLTATVFGGGFASQDYYLTDEGIQLEQSVTEGLGIVGRATGYQLWIEKNSTSPLAPSNNVVNRLNFGRLEAGVDLSPMQGTNLVLLGGHDVGDSDAWIIEADFSTWMFLSSQHPVNLFIAPVHDFQNDVTSSEIDVRVVAMQTPDWVLLLGAGGAVYGGGFISGLAGQGGPIVGVYNKVWQLGADLQVGGGSPGVYGMLNLYKVFSIPGL